MGFPSGTFEDEHLLVKPEVSLIHYSEENFLERFREDLIVCTRNVIILSPFVSQNRAIHYYPALHVISLRQLSPSSK